MHIQLKMSPNIWHEKHDAINIKLIFIITAILSVLMLILGVGNKPFFALKIYFPKDLLQNIGQENLKVTSDNLVNQQNNPLSGGEIGNYANFKIAQLIEKLNDATSTHQRLSLFCFSTQGVETANVISKLGTQVIEPLTLALNDPRPMIRGNAALALGLIKDNGATKSIIALLDDKNPIVRMKTAMALASIDNPQSTAALIEALNDVETEVRAEAVRALAGRREDYKVKKALVGSLNDKSWLVRSEVKAALQ